MSHLLPLSCVALDVDVDVALSFLVVVFSTYDTIHEHLGRHHRVR